MAAPKGSNRASEVIYQVYPASFCDANGDGHGDLKGITSKLDYIKSLNVDAVWVSPIFLSPEGPAGDGGYAVSNYREVGAKFGTNEDFKELIDEAHKRGLRVYTDFVMCHTSDEHEWFKKSVNREPGYENRYVWHDGKIDEQGVRQPPNNWKSVFSDPATNGSQSAWTFNEERGQYYLRHFNSSQPALNMNDEATQTAVLNEMKFWLDMGVDGMRLDALPYANYDPEFRDNPWLREEGAHQFWSEQYMQHSICQPQTVQLVERIRKLLDSYDTPKRAIGEVIAGREGGSNSLPVAAEYLDAEKGLHTCYTEGLIKFWNRYPTAEDMKQFIRENEQYSPDGGFCNNACNHDFPRTATRMTEGVPQEMKGSIIRQLMSLHVALPGSFCMYQGEELGLPQARIPEDIAPEQVKDGVVALKDCRDGARTPMPWDATQPNLGFSSTQGELYLPHAASHHTRAVATQEREAESMLNFTRELLKERQQNPALQVGKTRVLDTPEPILAFVRETDDQTVLLTYNMSSERQQFRPADYLDAETIAKAGITSDKVIQLNPYGFKRYGLRERGWEHSHTEITPSKLHENGKPHSNSNGRSHKRVFALDYLVADNHLDSASVQSFVGEYDIKPDHKYFIDDEHRHQRLLHAHEPQDVSLGGHTGVVLGTLQGMLGENLDTRIFGLAGNGKAGDTVRHELDELGVKIVPNQWPEGIHPETAISHVIHFPEGRNALVTHSGTNAIGVNALLQTDEGRRALEENIAASDVVYLPGSLTKKFGRQMTERITELRWKHNKEMVLSLPVHADFGPDDIDQIKFLIPSANVVAGSDTEYCRLLGLDTKRPIPQSDMDKVVQFVQQAFSQHVLQDNGKPCPKEQVALITRGKLPSLLITENKVVEVPPMDTGVGKSKFAVGDTAIAGFLAGYMTPGVSHEQAAKLSMRMAGHKILQDRREPMLEDPHVAFEVALQHRELAESADKYRYWDTQTGTDAGRPDMPIIRRAGEQNTIPFP